MDGTACCYVCADDSWAPPSPCACTDRHLHVACQLRMIAYSWDDTCGVCKHKFRNVSVRTSHCLYPTVITATLLFYALMQVVLLVALYTTQGTTAWYTPLGNSAPLLAAMAAVLVISVYVVRMARRRNLPFWAWRVSTAKVVIVPCD